MSVPAWSFSSLTSFETCPRQVYHLRVAKDVVEVPHAATTWGKTVHEHLEKRARDGTPLPSILANMEPIVAKIVNTPGIKLVEQQLAINEQLKPTGWWDKDVWCRGVVDVGVLTGKRALLLDWKTGKRKVDSSQLQLFAALAFSTYPSLEEITTGFVWLKDSRVDSTNYRKEDVPTIWQTFLPRVQRRAVAYETGRFPPKPSGLCRKHCPVPKSKCAFSWKD
jgi:hypothetical protein